MKSFKSLLYPAMLFGIVAVAALVAPDHHVAIAAGLPLFGLAGTVVNTKADIVSNLDREVVLGLPATLNNKLVYGGKLREQAGQLAIAAGDSANSVYRFGRIKSSARVSSIGLICGANGTGGVMDIGLYDIAANGGAVVSQHLFATGVDIHAAIAEPSEVGFANLTADQTEEAVWQLLALSADPGKEYDLCGTLTTNGGTAAKIALKLRYVEPNE